MNLFLSDIHKSFDLSKAGNPGGGPRTGSGGGPRTGAPRNVTSLPGPKTGNPGGGPRTGAGAGMKAPSTPGAVSGGGKQIVDCPLGAACPDGGKHQMGSAMYQEHLEQSMKHAQTGAKPNDESKGQPTEKPGVQPGSQNIGSLGSDQVQPKKPEASGAAGQGGKHEHILDEWENWENEQDSPRPSLASHLLANDNTLKHEDAKQLASKYEADIAKEKQEVDGKVKTQQMQLDPQEKKLRRNESRAKATKETPTVGAEATQEMPAATQEMDTSPTQKDMPPARPRGNKRIPPGDKELPDTAATQQNIPMSAAVDATGENPADERQTIRMQAVTGDPNKKRQPVPNPLDPNTAPINSKPADHYKLSQVARASGDEEGAKAQEELARKRSASLSSDDHKQLADQLRKDGMHEQADYHDGIHKRVNEYKGEAKAAEDSEKKEPEKPAEKKEWFELEEGTPEWEEAKKQRPGEHYHAHASRLEREHGIAQGRGSKKSSTKGTNNYGPSPEDRKRVKDAYESRKKAAQEAKNKKHEDKVEDVHKEQSSKASQDLDDAKKKHEETKAKAQEMAEKAKAAGKQPPAASKKKVEPELKAPGSEGEKLKHENHTSRAQRTADMIESHLKNNETISPADRKRLERAHKMAVYHSKIDYTPTAAHKSELGEVERTAKDLGIKEHWDDIKAKEDSQATAAAVKDANKEKATKDKADAKAAAKNQKEVPKPPETPMDHAKVADHKNRAKKLREKLQSHKDGNPNMSEEDHAVADQVMKELEEHENNEHVPTGDMEAKLKELHKLAGDKGKKHYEPEEEGAEPKAGALNRRDTAGFLLQQFHSGRAVGAGLAQSATSPYGAAGHLAPQLAGYGLHGATSAGHKLLQRTEDGVRTQDKLDDQKDAQAKEAEKQQKKAEKADKPELRGLAGGAS